MYIQAENYFFLAPLGRFGEQSLEYIAKSMIKDLEVLSMFTKSCRTSTAFAGNNYQSRSLAPLKD